MLQMQKKTNFYEVLLKLQRKKWNSMEEWSENNTYISRPYQLHLDAFKPI